MKTDQTPDSSDRFEDPLFPMLNALERCRSILAIHSSLLEGREDDGEESNCVGNAAAPTGRPQRTTEDSGIRRLPQQCNAIVEPQRNPANTEE